MSKRTEQRVPRFSRTTSRGRQIALVRQSPLYPSNSQDFLKNVRLEKHNLPDHLAEPVAGSQTDQFVIRGLKAEIERLKNDLQRHCRPDHKSTIRCRVSDADSNICTDCSKFGERAKLEIEHLKEKVSQFEMENKKLIEELRELEGDLTGRQISTAKGSEAAHHAFTILQKENLELKDRLSNLETNLLRCEKSSAAIHDEKSALQVEMKALKTQNKKLNDQIRSSTSIHKTPVVVQPTFASLNRKYSENLKNVAKWQSEKNLSIKNNGRLENFLTNDRYNPYCPVCRCSRGIKSNSIDKHLKNTADSGVEIEFFDKNFSPERSHFKQDAYSFVSDKAFNDQCRALKDEIHKLKVEKAVTETEKCSALRHCEEKNDEIKRLRREIHDTKSSLLAQCQCDSPVIQRLKKTCGNKMLDSQRIDLFDAKTKAKFQEENLKLSKENLELKSEIQGIKSKFESEKARYEANFSLFTAQKLKADQDHAKLLEWHERSESSNEMLRKHLRDTDARLEKLFSELKPKSSSSSNAVAIEDLHNYLQDLKSQLKLVERERSNSEAKLNELTKNFQHHKLDNGRLREKLVQYDKNIQVSEELVTSLRLKIADLETQCENKDKETQKLRLIISDLENEFIKFKKCLGDQKTNFTKLECDLAQSQSLNENLEKLYSESSQHVEQLTSKLQQYESENLDLCKQLDLSLNEQEKLKNSLKKLKETFKTYESSLKEKENERCEMFSGYKEIQNELKRIENVRDGQEKLLETRLDELQKVRDQALALKMENTEMGRQLDDLSLELQLCKSQITQERENASELEHQLRSARDAQLACEIEASQRREDAKFYRDKLSDCELTLKLQGEDLKTLRSKLEKKQRDLEDLQRHFLDDYSARS